MLAYDIPPCHHLIEHCDSVFSKLLSEIWPVPVLLTELVWLAYRSQACTRWRVGGFGEG